MENNATLPVQERFQKPAIRASEPVGPPLTLPSPLQWRGEGSRRPGEGSFTGKTTGRYAHGLWLMALVGTVLVLFVFPPDRYPFYPQCQFHRLTGLNCPGCGSLRAAHELTQGHLGTAFRLNPLLVVTLPVAAVAGLRSVWRRLRGSRTSARPIRPIWIWLGLGLVLAFGVLRNLPPLDRLGP